MKAEYTAENLAWLVETYSDDIKGFALEICGLSRLDPWQKWLLESAIDAMKKKIAVASCHSSGKTLLASVIAFHRLVCYPQGRVNITSATEGQLKAAFGTTLTMIIEESLIGDWFDVSAEIVKFKKNKNIPGTKGCWIKLRAWSEARPESFAGVHCTSPLFIVDEASGVPASIFEAIEGSMMHPFSKLMIFGNPLKRRGELWDAFHTKKDFYHAIHVSAYDSSFISKEWIQEMEETYGKDSSIYRVRVLGEFPESDIDAFMPESLIKAAVNREVVVDKFELLYGGLDVGKFHDASVLATRRGLKLIGIKRYRTRDLMVLSELVGQEIVTQNIARLAVDANGIGSGVADRLRMLHPGIVFDVPLGTLDHKTDKTYFNGRTKWWGMAREWLKVGSIPNSKDLIEEGSSLLSGFDKHGRFQLESKKDAVKRGVSSPDHFDAFAYTFAIPKPVAEPKLNTRALEVSWN